jgi:hypothetical protein
MRVKTASGAVIFEAFLFPETILNPGFGRQSRNGCCPDVPSDRGAVTLVAGYHKVIRKPCSQPGPMRNPIRKVGYCLALGISAAVVFLHVDYGAARHGDVASTIIMVVSFNIAVFSSFLLLWFGLAAVGRARLLRGKTAIARWHVSAAEWERFRAFDAVRSAQDETLLNELSIRERTPAEGVDVIVGRRQLIVDGSYHALSGLPFVSAVHWLPAPADPECLEFALVYPRGRYGGTRRMSLRVPVPAASREDGVRVYWHYHVPVAKPQQGLVFRRPGLVFGWCIAFAVVAASIGAGALFLMSRGHQSDLVMFLMVLGFASAIGALLVFFVTLIVWLTRSRTSTDA